MKKFFKLSATAAALAAGAAAVIYLVKDRMEQDDFADAFDDDFDDDFEDIAEEAKTEPVIKSFRETKRD